MEPVFKAPQAAPAVSVPEHVADTNPQTSKHLFKRIQGDVLAPNLEPLKCGNGETSFNGKLPQRLPAPFLTEKLAELFPQ